MNLWKQINKHFFSESVCNLRSEMCKRSVVFYLFAKNAVHHAVIALCNACYVLLILPLILLFHDKTCCQYFIIVVFGVVAGSTCVRMTITQWNKFVNPSPVGCCYNTDLLLLSSFCYCFHCQLLFIVTAFFYICLFSGLTHAYFPYSLLLTKENTQLNRIS